MYTLDAEGLRKMTPNRNLIHSVFQKQLNFKDFSGTESQKVIPNISHVRKVSKCMKLTFSPVLPKSLNLKYLINFRLNPQCIPNTIRKSK